MSRNREAAESVRDFDFRTAPERAPSIIIGLGVVAALLDIADAIRETK